MSNTRGRTQKKLADDLAKELGLPTRTTRLFVQRFVDLVAEDIRYTGAIQLRGLGTFATYQRDGHHVTHPQTGQSVWIPPKKTVRYRPSRSLEASLNTGHLVEDQPDS